MDYRCLQCKGTGNVRLSGDSAPGLLYKFKIDTCPECHGRGSQPICWYELGGIYRSGGATK